MAKLPVVKVDGLFGFYLRPDGASGGEAIVYLPAFNAEVREQYAKKGLKLLSDIRGDFSQKGEGGLQTGPPSDEMIDFAVQEIQSRVKGELARMKADLEATEGFLAEQLDSDERKLYQQRKRQLEKRIRDLKDEQPTFDELRQHFIREHRVRLQRAIPPNIRNAIAAMEEEQRWALEEQRQQREPVTVGAEA